MIDNTGLGKFKDIQDSERILQLKTLEGPEVVCLGTYDNAQISESM